MHQPHAVARDEIAHLPRDRREIRRLHFDDQIAAEDVDDVAVERYLDLVARLDVARPQRGVEVPFVENPDGRRDGAFSYFVPPSLTLPRAEPWSWLSRVTSGRSLRRRWAGVDLSAWNLRFGTRAQPTA
jgi:hypothetical protein